MGSESESRSPSYCPRLSIRLIATLGLASLRSSSRRRAALPPILENVLIFVLSTVWKRRSSFTLNVFAFSASLTSESARLMESVVRVSARLYRCTMSKPSSVTRCVFR